MNGGQKYVLRKSHSLRTRAWLTFKKYYLKSSANGLRAEESLPATQNIYFPCKSVLPVVASPETMEFNSGWGCLFDFGKRGILDVWILNNQTIRSYWNAEAVKLFMASNGEHFCVSFGVTGSRKRWSSRLNSLPLCGNNKTAEALKTLSPISLNNQDSLEQHGTGMVLKVYEILPYYYYYCDYIYFWATQGVRGISVQG